MTTKEILNAVATLLSATPAECAPVADLLAELVSFERLTAARLLAVPEGEARRAVALELEQAPYGVSQTAKFLATAIAGVPGAARRLQAHRLVNHHYTSHGIGDVLKNLEHPGHVLALDVIERCFARSGSPPAMAKQESALWFDRVASAMQTGVITVDQGAALLGFLSVIGQQ